MSNISPAEEYLLGQICQGDEEAWSQLVNRYQGRLLHFARAKLPQQADSEDVVQETFISFLKSLHNYRRNCSLETYLFTILRRKIIDVYRSKHAKGMKLIQDIYRMTRYGDSGNGFENLPAPDHTGSWYVSRNEQYQQLQEVLASALLKVINNLKKSLNFRDLEITELIFYCHLPNIEIARMVKRDENNVALVKHRCLKKVRENIARSKIDLEPLSGNFENLLNEVWQQQRLSCPKRSTIGAYLLETLEPKWRAYVDFHLQQIGCHFCRANLEDLQRQTADNKAPDLHVRIMESTVGFLLKP